MPRWAHWVWVRLRGTRLDHDAIPQSETVVDQQGSHHVRLRLVGHLDAIWPVPLRRSCGLGGQKRVALQLARGQNRRRGELVVHIQSFLVIGLLPWRYQMEELLELPAMACRQPRLLPPSELAFLSMLVWRQQERGVAVQKTERPRSLLAWGLLLEKDAQVCEQCQPS